MPKKFHKKALLTKPNSTVPSHFSSSASTSNQNDVQSERTVNRLIQELRKTDARNDHNFGSSPSVHPAVRDLLNAPVPSQRVPRNHLCGPLTVRRIPGPPPPRSWLSDSIHAPGPGEDLHNERWFRSRIQHQSSILPGIDLPNQESLIHHVLKRMAISWSWHAEFDHTYLATLPVAIREMFLSYIAIYDRLHWPNPLPFLLPEDMEPDEMQEVRRLDLTNSLGTWATIKTISKVLLKPSKQITRVETPESWDEPLPSTSLSSNNLRFTNLKHLSLALNSEASTSAASWAGLISLTSELSTLVSLSLAYWPQPTYTPNASKGRFKVERSGPTLPSVAYGGSNFYTAFDNDWREAAGILRSLSRALYCLEWLDLTGCGDWLSALVWQSPRDEEEEVWTATGPDWNGSWRGLQKIILAVGWSPGLEPDDDTSSTSDGTIFFSEPFTRHQEALDRLSMLRLGENQEQAQDWETRQERRKYYHRKELERYQAAQTKVHDVAQQIRSIRKGHGGHWIDFEFDDPS